MAAPEEDPIGVALRVGAAITKIGGAYFVGGSLASSLQGEPRATNDIDLFAVGSSPFDDSEFSRRKAVQVRPDGATLVVKSPEDTVLRKLLWYQAGGNVSDRQWRDVVQVLRISGGQMDASYLEGWAKRIGVSPLLRQAIEDAGGLSGSTS